MSLLVTCDPGIRVAGIAVFQRNTKTLQRAFLIKNKFEKGNRAAECLTMGQAARIALFNATWTFSPASVTALGVEWPQAYRPGMQKGDQNDLFALAAVSTAVANVFPHVTPESFLPREWKGTLDGDVMVRRVHGRLSSDELERVEWASKSCDPLKGTMHNVFDAIGIGLHMLGRLDPVKVYDCSG